MKRRHGNLTFTWTRTTLEGRYSDVAAFRVDVFEDMTHAGHWFIFADSPPISQGVYLHEPFRRRGVGEALAKAIVKDYSCPIHVVSSRIRPEAKSFFDRLEQAGYVTII